MFHAFEFSYAGISSASFGLMVYDIDGHTMQDVSFGNKGTIIEQRTIGRIQPLHFGVNYHNSPLTFKLIFGTTSADGFDRFDMQRVSLWLTGYQQYQPLVIHQPELEYCVFRCLITELQPISVAWLQVAYEANVVCDCPYAYSNPFEQTWGLRLDEASSAELVFRNESTTREPLTPLIRYELSDLNRSTSFQIVNQSQGGVMFGLTDIPASVDWITVDCQNGIILTNDVDYNPYAYLQGNIPRMTQGDNILDVYGINGVLSITGRFLYNVAA